MIFSSSPPCPLAPRLALSAHLHLRGATLSWLTRLLVVPFFLCPRVRRADASKLIFKLELILHRSWDVGGGGRQGCVGRTSRAELERQTARRIRAPGFVSILMDSVDSLDGGSIHAHWRIDVGQWSSRAWVSRRCGLPSCAVKDECVAGQPVRQRTDSASVVQSAAVQSAAFLWRRCRQPQWR
ncbi:uncharacterized protein J3D65DRAFT_636374 [Phyllosticta citribraziliensis]|uniref:Uncharacterized protein n=1 Tax=Phyllosticta citribraziliensis TaxID=989973 RepID=A0ABR1LCB2_9PEZI